jgi:hypothetical protein
MNHSSIRSMASVRSNVSFIGYEMPFLDQFFRAFEHAPFRLIHLDGASARAR